MYFYSQSTQSFYIRQFHRGIPDDAIQIDNDTYASFFQNQNAKTKKFVVKKEKK